MDGGRRVAPTGCKLVLKFMKKKDDIPYDDRIRSLHMNILIVEDEVVSRDLLKKLFVKMGHSVREVENGKQAWEYLRHHPCPLIITDWMMPELDGLELCRKIRSETFSYYVYVIVLTSRDQKEDLVEVFRAGADDYIPKPFDAEELRARVKTALRVVELEKRHKQLNTTLTETASQIDAKNKKLESALKRLEDTQAQMIQSEKMASIGQLAAGVAHEINNPTGYVSSNLKTLNDYQQEIAQLIEKYQALVDKLSGGENGGALDQENKKEIETVKAFEEEIDIDYLLEDIEELIGDCREGTDRIKKIVQDLKDFAHPGEDKLQLMDINKGLNSTLNVVNNELKYKATLHKQFGDIPEVKAYPQQLNQVFMNILVNAAQAIDRKGDIFVTTRKSNGFAEVEISDTGCGIAPEVMTRIFDPFFTTKDVGKGTGLGMNIAYNIVKKHDGTIDVKSELGKGTSFTIRIPIERAE
jgi:signal transduction histidine kinase